MKSNKTIVGLSACLIIATISAVTLSNDTKSNKKIDAVNHKSSIDAEVASDFNTNVRTLSARLKKDERDNKVLRSQIKKMMLEIDSLSKRNQKTSHIETQAEVQKLKQQVMSLSHKLMNQKNNLKTIYPVDDVRKQKQNQKPYYVDIDKLADDNSINIKKSEDEQRESMTKIHHRMLSQKTVLTKPTQKVKVKRFFTIPAGSDVQNATLLTALIGEVPLKGKLVQPLFPFSTLISRGDLMAANGIELPREIIGMKVGGFAYGVGSFLDNISCVRAYATSMLFVFRDGTYKTIVDNNQESSATLLSHNSIGYLTDQFGNPCIKGRYQTNAPQVLTALVGAGIVKGAGSALSQWQQSINYGQGNVTQMPTGSFGKFLGGQAASEGSGLGAEWLKDRLGDSFDIVYVPSSIPFRYQGRTKYRPNRLMLHFTKSVEIDKASTSRRIHYGNSNNTYDNRF